MPYLEIVNVTKSYKTLSGKTVDALKEISLSIADGEFLTVVGTSGSGKSTLLHILAGIERPTSGKIEFANGMNKQRIGFVFQANTIFPWRTVAANLTYALELQKIDSSIRKQRAVDLCQLVGLDPGIFLDKYPKELSGGEKRRVAIGMALAQEAQLLLLDEPTSQLDYLTKWSVQSTILKLLSDRKFTTVFVTHDLDEAILLGDRVLILDKGTKKAIINVDLPKPRHESLRSSEEFNSYRNRLIDLHGITSD